MLIDWFTVIAQVINFLILLFLLHRFLYQPILKTIDKRQQKLKTQWQSAHKAEADANAEASSYRQAQRELDAKRDQILADAKADAEAVRKAHLQQIREDIDVRRQEWQNALEDEQRNLLAEMQQQFGHRVVMIVERILSDLANADLEQSVIQVFQHKLRNLDADTRAAIAHALTQHNHPITIQTGFDLNESDRDALCQTLQDTQLVNGQAVQFDVSPDLIIGIRLHNDAYDLAWTASDYLRELEQSIHPSASQSVAHSQSSHPS
jgi:F-type H+-transporting ATPase subunit b